ncbi:hypothetical protein [Clostridium sp.]|uniref:hypothetical protein n=1 Tax=Clostridium sp. TaxID=1506 RepID=UPI003F676973
MGQALTELLNALVSVLNFINPNNEKDLGLRISLFMNAAFLVLICFVAVRVEPYFVECGTNKAQIQGMNKLLEEERKNSALKSLRIDSLENQCFKLKP